MSAPAELDPDRVARTLQTARYGRSLRVLALTDSTNDDARRDAEAGAPDGHAVVADGQRSGRGSKGRSWASPPGSDLYVSIVARPEVALAQLPPLTLAVGLGVAQAVEQSGRGNFARVEVKWPNDVWITGRKCAGILVEASSSGAVLGPIVIGIGLNVNRRDFPDELRESATSLHNEFAPPHVLDRGEVLARLLLDVEHWVDRFVAEGAAAVVAALEGRLAMRGRRVRCGTVEGVLVDVAPSGAVRIASGGALHELVGGRLEPI